MKPSRSSSIALRLLERVLACSERESLIGDIEEQATRGRPATWVWAEALVAVARDTAREARTHPVANLATAFFLGYGAAAILGTVKLLPGLHLVDQIMAGVAAGWIVGRSGGLPAVATFAALVLAMRSPTVLMPVMGVLDHFHGAWLLAAYGLAALPYSIVIAATCIGAGGLWAACRRPLSTIS